MKPGAIAAVFAIFAVSAHAADLTPEQKSFFESKVRPVLAENCYKCHSIERDKSKGDLTLDTRDGVLKGGEDGAVIVPGDPEHSALIRAVRYVDPDLQMPPTDKKSGEPDKKLSDQDIAALTEWVKMGAPDPRTAPVVARPCRPCCCRAA